MPEMSSAEPSVFMGTELASTESPSDNAITKKSRNGSNASGVVKPKPKPTTFQHYADTKWREVLEEARVTFHVFIAVTNGFVGSEVGIAEADECLCEARGNFKRRFVVLEDRFQIDDVMAHLVSASKSSVLSHSF